MILGGPKIAPKYSASHRGDHAVIAGTTRGESGCNWVGIHIERMHGDSGAGEVVRVAVLAWITLALLGIEVVIIALFEGFAPLVSFSRRSWTSDKDRQPAQRSYTRRMEEELSRHTADEK
jgi:hypothetical protein